MSDFVSCCSDGVVDDVVLLERGILMMRALFSNPVNFGPYAGVADRYRFIEPDNAKNGIDVFDWTERHRDGIYTRPCIFVNVEAANLTPPQWIDDEGEPTSDGSTTNFIYIENVRLVFRAVSAHGAEVRLLSRIILTYLQGMKNFLTIATNGQVHHFRPLGKTPPVKVKEEINADNRWASDVPVEVEYQIAISSALIAPVLENIIVEQPLP